MIVQRVVGGNDRLPSVDVDVPLVARLRFDEVEVVADPTLLVKAERVQDLHFRALPTHVELRDNDQRKRKKKTRCQRVPSAVAALHTTKARHNHVPSM